MRKKSNSQAIDPSVVDVVIPVRGRLDLLSKCLAAIPLAFDPYMVNIVVVDNNSKEVEEDITYLDEFQGSYGNIKSATTIHLKTNEGFPKACNIGARRKTSKYIFFLNSDCFLNPGSGTILVDAMENNPKIGVAGMKLLFPDYPTGLNQEHGMRPMGKIQHIGLSTKINGTVHHVFIGWRPDHPKVNAVNEVFAVTGAALMTRRSLFTKVGGFYEGYGLGCLSGDTYIFTDKGIELLSSLFPDPNVELHYVNKLVSTEYSQREASLAYNNGVQPTLKVTLEKDFQIHGTRNHKIRTMDTDGTIGWKPLDDLKIGDYVPVRYGMKSFGANTLSDDVAYLIGLYLAEGSYEKVGRISIVSSDKEIQSFLSEKFQFKPHGTSEKAMIHWRRGGIDFCKELSKYVDFSKKAFTKELSPFLMQMDEQSTRSLLQGMFDGDGCAVKDGRVNYSTSSYKLAKQLQLILLNFGMVVGIYPRTCTTGWSNGSVNYLLDFGSYSKTFHDLIGFRLERKQKNREFVRENRSINIPYQRETFKSLYGSFKYEERNYKEFGMHANNPSHGVRKDTIQLLLEYARSKGLYSNDNKDLSRLQDVMSYDWYWLKVKSIEDGGEINTYDLHVPVVNNYLADGVVVHNSYEDVDYCVTLRNLGYNIIVIPEAVGVHYTGATVETYKLGYPMNQNASIFLSRHMNDMIWWDYWIL